MKKILLLLILFSFSTYLPEIASAQLNLNGGVVSLTESLNVILAPTYPHPNETVYVSLEMYSADLDSADISWYKNGKLAQKGRGLKNFSFVSGNAGSRTDIKIQISLQNGTSFSKNLTIEPVGVNIVWQADSYTPPFYKGKALLAPQGQMKLVASANFSPSKSATGLSSGLIYEWSINGTTIPEISGYGKNVALINGSILGKPLEISVLATDPSTGITASDYIVASPTKPLIKLYENSPLYGVLFNQSVGEDFSMRQDEVNILAVPYNMSASDINSLSLLWKINGLPANDVGGRSTSFRKPSGVNGLSNISVEMSNPNKPLQYSSASFTIKFQENASQ